MRGCVDEIRKAEQCGREPDSRAIERCNKDLRVAVEGLRGVKVVGYEVLEPPLIGVFFFLDVARDRHIGTSTSVLVSGTLRKRVLDMPNGLRAEKAALCCKDRDVDVVHDCYLA